MLLPTIKEVPYEKVLKVLSAFTKIFAKVDPEKQKDLLHSIIRTITVTPSLNIKERCIKDIELFFDTLHKQNFVLTCGTVHRITTYLKRNFEYYVTI